MKHYLIVLITLFIIPILYSCNKSKDNADKVHRPQTLPGSWEFRSYYGGYGATGGGTSEPGNGTIYSFTDNAYIYYSEGNPQQSGTYTLTTAPNPNTGEEMPAIAFDNMYTICYSIKDDKLTLYQGLVAADGTVDTYVRIANAGEKTK